MVIKSNEYNDYLKRAIFHAISPYRDSHNIFYKYILHNLNNIHQHCTDTNLSIIDDYYHQIFNEIYKKFNLSIDVYTYNEFYAIYRKKIINKILDK